LINLINEPNPADALRPNIGHEYSTNYKEYVENAKVKLNYMFNNNNNKSNSITII